MLTAPFAGTVVALDVDRGDSVGAGQIVLRILSDERQVRFAFPPGEVRGAGEAVSIRLAGTRLRRGTADVSAIRPEVDPAARAGVRDRAAAGGSAGRGALDPGRDRQVVARARSRDRGECQSSCFVPRPIEHRRARGLHAELIALDRARDRLGFWPVVRGHAGG